MKSKTKTLFCVFALAFTTLLASPLAAQTGHPGRVDFASLDSFFDEEEVTVDVTLGGWLLSWAKTAAEGDPDLEMISKIESIRVKVFRVSEGPSFKAQADRVVKSLIGDGWERFARVNEKDSWVHVLVKGNATELAGITVVAMDDDAEAVLVNVAGRLDPADVAAILDDGDLMNVDLDLDFDDA